MDRGSTRLREASRRDGSGFHPDRRFGGRERVNRRARSPQDLRPGNGGFVWDATNGVRDLQDLTGVTDSIAARAISDDGTLVVGSVFPELGRSPHPESGKRVRQQRLTHLEVAALDWLPSC